MKNLILLFFIGIGMYFIFDTESKWKESFQYEMSKFNEGQEEYASRLEDLGHTPEEIYILFANIKQNISNRYKDRKKTNLYIIRNDKMYTYHPAQANNMFYLRGADAVELFPLEMQILWRLSGVPLNTWHAKLDTGVRLYRDSRTCAVTTDSGERCWYFLGTEEELFEFFCIGESDIKRVP